MALIESLAPESDPAGSSSPLSPLTLGELLAEPAFGLELVVGQDHVTLRRVAGVHAVEVPLRDRCLPRASVALTTGLRLRRDPRAQRRLVAELAAHQLTALGFALGPVFRSIPRALLDEARERDLPVFSVPARTPLREIVELAGRRAAHDDQLLVRRVLAMQEYLIDALAQSDTQMELVTRLSVVLEAGVAIFSPKGQIVQCAGRLPPDAWEQLQAIGMSGQDIARDRVWVAADGRLLLAPIVSEDQIVAWLAVAQRHATLSSSRIALPVVRVARRVLAAFAGARRLAEQEDHLLRVDLLHAALDGIDPLDAERLGARAAAAGFDFGQLVRVAVFEPADGSPAAQPGDLLACLAGQLRATSTPAVLTQRRGAVVGLVEGDDEVLEAVLAGARRAGLHARAGVGRALSSIQDAKSSYRDASIAVAADRRHPRATALTNVEHLELVEAILTRCDAEELEPAIIRWLGPVRNDPMLWDTLMAYLSCDMDVQKTSDQLYLHANSVRYRLRRIESLLGEPLRSASTLANLYVAYLSCAFDGPTRDLTTAPSAS